MSQRPRANPSPPKWWGAGTKGIYSTFLIHLGPGANYMKIIEAEERHVPEIVGLWVDLMNFHKELNQFHILRDGAEIHWEKYLRKCMESETDKVFIATDENDVIGYIIVKIKEYPPLFRLDHFGFISDMYVDSGHRRKGIGKKLLNKAYEWFDSHKIERVELRVEPKNENGYSFWRKHGYEEHVRVLSLDK